MFMHLKKNVSNDLKYKRIKKKQCILKKINNDLRLN